MSFAGAVLTGGRSRRMGQDKALLAFGGRPLARRVADVLSAAGADPVVAVGGDAAALRGAGLHVVPDRHPGDGPVGGILTALEAVPDALVVMVVACDLPDVAPLGIRRVVAALDARPEVEAAVPIAGGRLQPLHAAWRPSAAAALREVFEAGERSVTRAIGAVRAVTVEGLDDSWFTNLNTPEDLLGLRVGHTGVMSQDATPEIDVTELAARRERGSFLLDVRQPDEYETGHVPGAVLIPLDQLPARQDEVPADQEVLVICRSGGRSAAAVEALNRAGYRATNVAGGTLAWIDAGLPVVEGSAAG